MTNRVEILLTICALITSAVIIVGFFVARSRIRKSMLNDTRIND